MGVRYYSATISGGTVGAAWWGGCLGCGSGTWGCGAHSLSLAWPYAPGQALARENDSAKIVLGNDSTNQVKGQHKNGAHRHLCPWMVFQEAFAPLAVSLKLVKQSLAHMI